ncbi:MAG: phosphatidate cytidylyltransferase [Deltaproteobacteria bacterium]|nr:phosphatidate cytidylyltransferase [Deltaproteobacteria bacterium]
MIWLDSPYIANIPISHAISSIGLQLGESLKRVAAALVLIPIVVLAALYADAFWLCLAASAIILGAILEYNNFKLTGKRDSLGNALLVVFAVASPFAVFVIGEKALLPLVIGATFVFFIHGIVGRAEEPKDAALSVALKTLGLVYIALPITFLFLIAVLEPQGRLWLLFLLIVIWANDTFAYCTGRLIGRHKLSPEISPGKTIEGAVGGLIGGGLAAYVFNHYVHLGIAAHWIIALSIVIGVAGIFGDLAESLLKRSAGVKDSGSIIPGHGGILDRMDSLFFSAPILYYFLLWGLRTLTP